MYALPYLFDSDHKICSFIYKKTYCLTSSLERYNAIISIRKTEIKHYEICTKLKNMFLAIPDDTVQHSKRISPSNSAVSHSTHYSLAHCLKLTVESSNMNVKSGKHCEMKRKENKKTKRNGHGVK